MMGGEGKPIVVYALGISTGISGLMMSSSQVMNMSGEIWGLYTDTVSCEDFSVSTEDGRFWPIYQFYPTN